MIRVKLDDNTFIDVQGTDDPRVAAQAGRRWFQQNRPEEFEAWRRTQLGLGSSAVQAASAGIDQFQSSLFSAAEGLGRAVGSPVLERFGREGRVEQQLQAETAFPSELRQAFTDVTGVGSAARATTEAVAGSLPSTAAGLAAALAGAKGGAKLGAVLGPKGALAGSIIGGIGGGAAAAFPQLFGTNIERQIQESGDITSPGAAARAAAIQAPLESAADVASLGAARVFRRPATEAAQAVGEGLGRRVAKGALVGAGIETPVELAQTALERQQAGLPVFTTEGGAGREYLEAGFGGAAAGGVTGGALRGAFGERPAPPATPAIPEGAFAPVATAAPAPAAAAPERPAPITLPDRPEPLATREEAEAFVAEDPQNRAPPISPDANPAAYVNLVNNRRIGLWEESVAGTKTQAVREFFPRAPDTRQITPDVALGNLAEAAGRGDLNLNSFTPNAVARAALASRDIDPTTVTPAQVSEASRRLDALAETGVIRRNVTETTSTEKGKKVKRRKTSYAVNYGTPTQAQPAPTPTPAPEAAPPASAVPPPAEGAPIPEAAPAQAAPVEGEAIWQGPDADIPVRILPEAPQQGSDGRLYQRVNYEGRDSYVPADQLRPATPQTPDVDGPLAPWQVENRNAINDLLNRAPALAQRIRDLHSQGRVASEIARATGLDANDVRTARDILGLAPLGPASGLMGSIPQAGAPAPAARPAPAQPAARTTVEVNGVRRETTPETVRQTVDEMRAAPPTPKEEQLARALAAAEPASGAGETTRTGEEALLNTPKNMPLKEQNKILDAQYRDIFAGGKVRKFMASPLTGLARQPEYQEVAAVGKEYVGEKYKAVTDFAQSLDPLRTLPPESQARAMLTLQESSARRQMWNREAFTPEENAAMDGVIATGQQGLDLLIDAYTKRYFDPNQAKTPEDRARLEAFQRTKGDRLITQVPDAELRAASDIGAREVRTMNARRNPFYMPQVATGSHFVGAYERQPGGKEKLVRVYFYNRLRWAQRQRQRVGAQRDFEALSIQALRDEFPDRSRFRIMERGMEATSDKEGQALNLKRDGELIASYLDELKQVSGPEAKRIIDRLSKQIDKAKMDRFFKPNNDILRAVTPWNAVDYARETLPNYYLALANIQARLAIQDDFVRAQRGLNNEEKAYWDAWLNLNSTPVEALGTARAVAGAWFLGGNLSTALMQFTQNPVVLPGRFARDGAFNLGVRLYGSAARTVYGSASPLKALGKELTYSKQVAKNKRLSAEEVAALKRAIDEGVVRPSTIVNIRGQFDADDFRRLGLADQSAAGAANGMNNLLDLSFRFLSAVDETNRTIAFLAAHKLAKARPEVMTRAGRIDNTTYATPYDYAVSVANETNFVGGPEDQPLIARFHPSAQVMTQFLGPSFKFIELFARSAALTINGLKKSDLTLAKAGAVMFGLMLVTQTMLAGLWSLPFADRLKELTEFVLSKAFDTEIDFEQAIEKLPISSVLAATLNYGLPHALNMVTLSERLKIDVLPSGSISDWDVFSLLGPIGGLLEKPLVAAQAYSNDDPLGVAYALLPTSLANALKGAEIGITGEQWTRAGGRIITPEQVQTATEQAYVPPAIRQAIGFAPPEFADIRRSVRRAQEMREPLQRDTEKANRELSLIMLRMYEAQILGQTAEAQALGARLQQRAAEINAEQEGKPEHLRVRLNRRAIEERARQDLQGRGSLDVLLRRAPASQREEIIRMYERTVGPRQ
jgi:hypothetical protein